MKPSKVIKICSFGDRILSALCSIVYYAYACVCVCACMCGCVLVCMHVYVSMHVYECLHGWINITVINMCMCSVHAYIHMYVCMWASHDPHLFPPPTWSPGWRWFTAEHLQSIITSSITPAAWRQPAPRAEKRRESQEWGKLTCRACNLPCFTRYFALLCQQKLWK